MPRFCGKVTISIVFLKKKYRNSKQLQKKPKSTFALLGFLLELAKA